LKDLISKGREFASAAPRRRTPVCVGGERRAPLPRDEHAVRRPPLPFAPPHSTTASCSKGRLIRCTVPGLTPNCWAMTRTPGLPGVARASWIRFSSAGAIGGQRGARRNALDVDISLRASRGPHAHVALLRGRGAKLRNLGVSPGDP